MKKATILFTISMGVLALASCSKKDCVCTTTVTTSGVAASSTETVGEGLSSTECDVYDSNVTVGNSSTVKACELE